MVLNYDRNPNLTEDQKLQSLVENVQRALDELQTKVYVLENEVKKLKERT